MTQPAKGTEYKINPCTRNEYGITQVPSRVSGWDTKGSQFTATIEIDPGRNYVELVQTVIIPMLTLVQNKIIYLLLFSLSPQS
jgi:hypothetical protein